MIMPIRGRANHAKPIAIADSARSRAILRLPSGRMVPGQRPRPSTVTAPASPRNASGVAIGANSSSL
jgi:hypothetical protein